MKYLFSKLVLYILLFDIDPDLLKPNFGVCELNYPKLYYLMHIFNSCLYIFVDFYLRLGVIVDVQFSLPLHLFEITF